MMFVKITYHVGSLGPVPPSAFESEVRESLVRESNGDAFTLQFVPMPGFGILPLDEQIQVGGAKQNVCAAWLETIGNELVPSAFAVCLKRFR